METEIVLSKPVLLAEAVQRFRVLPVRVPGELDNEGPTDLPEVRAMSTANAEAHGRRSRTMQPIIGQEIDHD